jgi:hypothetical protein
MISIDKEYPKPFLLEPTKLNRLVDKIHERLGDHANTTAHESFDVFMSGNRHEELPTVDSVLELENSRKYTIQRLLITCSAATRGAVRPEHEVRVDFGKEKKTQQGSNVKLIEVDVRSDSPGWANRTLSEVEEQVERTWIQNPIPVGALAGLLALLLFLIVLLLVGINHAAPRTDDILRAAWLTDADLNRVEQILAQNRTMTDEEMREVETRRLRNILQDEKPQQMPTKSTSRSVWLLLVPLVILGICVLLLLKSYPTWVFLWGDEVERYNRLVQRRKIIWNVIIGIVVVSVVGNLLSARVLSLFFQ